MIIFSVLSSPAIVQNQAEAIDNGRAKTRLLCMNVDFMSSPFDHRLSAAVGGVFPWLQNPLDQTTHASVTLIALGVSQNTFRES